ncbi:DUF6415 family natural product biosynthesis protein [Streptomyces sp. NPDC020799]|uniref:DUF6415 family natural product biosynthesis protein n=1 Tax=Streptomyces sp. NPDC020799 TaxID=3365091 RepID=UPI00378F4F7A
MNAADCPRPPSRLPALMTGDIPPLDLVTIRATARRALTERPQAMPRAEEIREITLTLRGHLELMLTEARERDGQFEPGTTQWYRWTALIERTRAELDIGSGNGLYSAFAHMQALARTTNSLADLLDE